MVFGIVGRVELERNRECGDGLSFGGGAEVEGGVLVIGGFCVILRCEFAFVCLGFRNVVSYVIFRRFVGVREKCY